jgi:hypothetical protein
VAAKKTKDVLEMLGDFFREAAVLVLIFYPLELAKDGNLSILFVLVVGIGCIIMLMMGIVFEKMRGM